MRPELKRFCWIILLLVAIQTMAQQNVHPTSNEYQWPTDPLVKARLDKWQDLKFGMIIHWGVYAVPGIIESWALCSEDWIERDSNMKYDEFKKWYWGLSKEFNPVKFEPDQWAKAAKEAGMKYVVFTTKHHDGFCMFDTKETDFKISAGPFKSNPKADVAKYVFDAFRKNDFMIGAYFSKPDWHSEYYWWPKYATADRNNNYDIKKFPWRWERYKQFTYNQLSELVHNYGSVDILWLDGGWVRPIETVTDEVRSWGAAIPAAGQDIDMPRIAAMARQAQPGILIVDRTVHGPYENYQTPEQRIPAKQLDHPWESCMTLGDGWGYIPNERFKSSTRVIHSLIEIVAKGGSLLLGIGPRADGTLQEESVLRMQEIGKWLNTNGNAIYNTRTVEHYQDGNTWFTRNKTGDLNYALVCIRENEALPATVQWKSNLPAKGTKMILLQTGEKVKWKIEGDMVKAELPKSLLTSRTSYPALAFSFTPQKN
jgi:alpha-L-fucosidase